MGWPKQLVLVRHAESEGNLLSVNSRTSLDVATHAYPLTARGRKQARITGEYLRKRFGDHNFDRYYTSYYLRAKETMYIMCPSAGVREDSRLAEAQRGIYHTMTRAQIKKKYPEELRRKEREGRYHYRPFGGENWPDVEQRVRSFLDTLKSDARGKKVLVVVHGHWFLLFQKIIHSFSAEEAVERYDKGVMENASVVTYCRSKNNPWLLVLDQESVVPWEGKLPKNPQTTR